MKSTQPTFHYSTIQIQHSINVSVLQDPYQWLVHPKIHVQLSWSASIKYVRSYKVRIHKVRMERRGGEVRPKADRCVQGGGGKEREYVSSLTIFLVFVVVVVILFCFFHFEVCRFYKYLE